MKKLNQIIRYLFFMPLGYAIIILGAIAMGVETIIYMYREIRYNHLNTVKPAAFLIASISLLAIAGWFIERSDKKKLK